MAVQILQNPKTIVKKLNSQFKRKSTPVVEEPNMNLYGEVTPNINLDIEALASALSGKMTHTSPQSVKAIDIDIKREIAIGDVDSNAVKSEVIEGKVNNRLKKLKELRRNGS
jgi:hypothetical protein